MKNKLAALLIVGSVASAQTPTPTPSLQQYLTARQVGAQQLFGSTLNSPIPQPVFGTQVLAVQATQCHYGSFTGGSLQSAYCGGESGHTIFSVQQGENMVDWMLAAGFTNAAVNFDVPMFIDNSANSVAARGVLNSVLAYAQGKGMPIILKPTYGGSGTSTWTVCMPTAGQSITGGSSTASTITFNVANTSVCGSGGTTACHYAGGTLSTSSTTTPAGLASKSFTIQAVTGTSVVVTSALNLAPTAGTIIGWSVPALQTCVTAENTSLQLSPPSPCNGFGTGCSLGAFLAATYSPKRYTVVNEPVSEDPLLGLSTGVTGTPTQWEAYGSATAAQVVAQGTGTKIGFSLSRLDNITGEHMAMQGITAASQALTGGTSTATSATVNVAYTGGIQAGGSVTIAGATTPSGYNGTYTVTAVTSTSITMNNTNNPGNWSSGGTLTSPLNYGGYDVYTDDPGNTINGLGLQQQYWQSDQAAGLETIWTEMWIPVWAPGGQVAGTLTNYEGIGNCDWNTYSVNRQSLVPMAIFGAANGITEIDMFSAAYAGVVCVYAGPVVPPPATKDCVTCAAYAEAVATALGSSTVPAQRTPLFYVLQNLLRWFPILAGQPLPL